MMLMSNGFDLKWENIEVLFKYLECLLELYHLYIEISSRILLNGKNILIAIWWRSKQIKPQIMNSFIIS